MKSKTELLDQYLYHDIDDEDEAVEYKKKAMPLVGAIVLYFNGLEKDLDSFLCSTIYDRADSPGLIVLHKLTYSAKVELNRGFYSLWVAMDNSDYEFANYRFRTR